MTDYTSKTDIEVDLMVALALDVKCGADVKDYCSDWAAIGPIIESKGIVLMPRKLIDGGFEWTTGYIQTDSTNPRRAAAIGFLMMNEVKG